MKALWNMYGKIFLLAALTLIFLFGVAIGETRTMYTSAFQDKYDREHAIKKPKIILIGGSSVAYGIDSELLEEEFAMPVVNMGLHAGLGQTFCMDLAKSGIHKDDIVIVLPEYYTFDVGLPSEGGVLAWLVLGKSLDLWKELPASYYGELSDSFPTYVKKLMSYWLSGAGSSDASPRWRDSFNRYGDIEMTGDRNIMKNGYLEEVVFEQGINGELMEYYNHYNEYVRQQGAVMLLAAPPIIKEPELGITEAKLDNTEQELRNKLDFPVLSELSDYLYPKEYFYDTNFHLNDTGRKYRTEQLIQELKDWISSGK